MTSPYDRLVDGPQTSIDRAQLAPRERSELRTMAVRVPKNRTADYNGTFTDVYYLEGHERRAAGLFVEENREQLKTVDFSRSNVVASSLAREEYDWVLHEFGERELRKYQRVVYERRSDGTEYVIDRKQFETRPARRYTTSPWKTAIVDDSIAVGDLYDDLGGVITPNDLREHDAIEGPAGLLLEYFRVAGSFDCIPITVDGDTPAIEKRYSGE